MSYSNRRFGASREMDSAEWAIAIFGFALFGVGILSALIVIGLTARDSRRAPQTVAMAPTAVAPATPTSPAPAPTPQSAYAPAPPVADTANASDPAQNQPPTDASSPSNEEPPDIALQPPWPTGPSGGSERSGDQGAESPSARLAREARERAAAAREEMRRRAEEARRRTGADPQTSSAPPSVPTIPYAGSHGPRIAPQYGPPIPTNSDGPQTQDASVAPVDEPQSEYYVRWRGRNIPTKPFGICACFVGVMWLGYAGFLSRSSSEKRIGEILFGVAAIVLGILCIFAPALLAP